MVKEQPAKSGDAGDSGSIPGSGRSLGIENSNPLQFSCLGIPWAEKPGGLQSTRLQSQTEPSTCAQA